MYNQRNLFHSQTKHSILKGSKLICELLLFVRVNKYDRTSEQTSGRYKQINRTIKDREKYKQANQRYH